MLFELTARQREVLDFIKERIASRGAPPTVREIMDFIGSTSPNGVVCHLKALEKKGYIEREWKQARSIQLTDKAKGRRGLPLLTLDMLHDPSWRLS